MKQRDASIKIALTNLGKYNEGELVYKWVELPASEEELNDVLREIGINEQYEEFFISDYESPIGIRIGEYENIEKLNEIAEALEELEEREAEAVVEIVNDGVSSDYADAIQRVKDGEVMFYFDCDDLADVAYEWHEQTGTDMDAPLMGYVDWERVGRDMAIEGTFYELSNRVWVQVMY